MATVAGVTLRILSGLAVRGAFEGGIVAEYEAKTGNHFFDTNPALPPKSLP